jgi:exopolyphosphatase
MKDFQTYLKNIRPMWNKLNSNGFSHRPAITLGNVSCDMDSVVASIMLGYFLTNRQNRFVFPILNCNEKSFALKLDIMSALADHKINPNDLLFFSEVEVGGVGKMFDVYLVDHNELDVNQSFLKDSVLGIIDHHVDGQSIHCPEFRVVEKAGSACTLIYKNYLDQIIANSDLAKNYSRLMLAPLFLDSFHFNPELYNVKFFDDDRDMVSLLSELTGQSIDHDYYLNLQKLKEKSFDLKFIGLLNAIQLDYKNYQIAETKVGISVVIGAFKDLIDNFGVESIVADLEKFSAEKKLDVYLAILYYETQGVFHKELLIFDNGYSHFPEFKTGIEMSDLLLEESGLISNDKCRHFHMRNVKYTRKTVEPIVKEIVNGMKI